MTKGTFSIYAVVFLMVSAALVALVAVGQPDSPIGDASDVFETPNVALNSNGFFTENTGQWSKPFQYMGDTSFGQVAFGRSAVYLNIITGRPEVDDGEPLDPRSSSDDEGTPEPRQTGYVVKLSFVGASDVIPMGYDVLSGYNNYLYGNDPDGWRTEVPNYAGVIFKDLWTGIDLRYFFNDEGLKYELVLSPGADPNRIIVSVDGADELSIKGGELVFKFDGSTTFSDGGLVAYYNDGSGEGVSAEFNLAGNDLYSFTLNGYDQSRGCVIDPLYYSTYLGGSSTDYGYAIDVDSSFNAYVVGYTASSNFPVTTGAYDTSLSSSDGYVTKINVPGSNLYYSTYFGGTSTEYAYGVAVDSSGNAYVTGYTTSTNFPTTSGAYDTTSNGGNDVFVLKLNSAGTSLTYATYLGGTSTDYGYAIDIDSSGNAYITGTTYGSGFPATSGAYDTSHNGYYDAFVTKLNSGGTGLSYSTFLGGDDYDYGFDIVVDSSGNAIVTGYTYGWNIMFPTTSGAYDTTHNGGYDAFVTKLNSAGSSLTFSTFLGSDSTDYGYGVDIDSSGNVYVACYTYGGATTIFPTTSGAFDTTHNGGYDVAVCKLNSAGTSLTASTFVGGSSTDYPYRDSLKVGYNNNVFVAGYTGSSTFPVTSGAYDTTYNGMEGFLFNLSADFTTLSYCTFFGSTSSDYCYGMAIDRYSNCYMTGYTLTTSFPVSSDAYDTTHNGGNDAYIFKFGTHNLYDNIAPSLVSDTSDSVAYSAQYFNFRVAITDSVGVTKVHVEYWIDSGSHTNATIPTLVPYNYRIMMPASLGTLYYFFSARDHYGNWLKGPTASKIILDGIPPSFSNIYFSSTPTTGEVTTIYADVTDNVGVNAASVTFNYRNWRDSSYTSVTMTNVVNDTYSHTFTCGNDWETLYYYITARDTSSNLGTSSTYVTSVYDDENPTLVSDDSLTTAYTGDGYTFDITLNDNVGIAWCDVTYWFGSGWSSYYTLYPTTSGYGVDQQLTGTITIPLTSIDPLYYYLDFYDDYYNWGGTSTVMVTVEDNDVPTVESINNPMATTGDAFQFIIGIDDNIDGPQVEKVHVLRSYNYNWASAVNMTLTYDSVNQEWKSSNFNVNLNSLDPLTYNITAVDDAGNWMKVGPIVEVVYDNDLPTYTWPDSSPSIGTTGDPFTFTMKAADNIDIGMVIVVPEYADGADIDPMQLTEGPAGTFTGTINLAYRSISTMSYKYLIYDTSYNMAETPSDTVSVSDNDNPEIVSDMSPKSASAANEYTFKTLVLDNIGVENVWMSYWYDDDPTPRTLDMENLAGGFYYYTITLPAKAGTLYYYFDAVDEWGNSPDPTPTKDVKILDSYPPELSALTYGPTAYTGDTYTVKIDVIDDVQVDFVKVYYYFGDLMPGSLKEMGGSKSGNTFTFDIEVPDALEDLHFWIEAADKVGNPSVTPMIDVPVMDNDAPEVTEDNSDGMATTGDPFNIDIICIDNIAVSKVDVSYLLPGAVDAVVAPLLRDGDVFSITLQIPNDKKGDMTYKLLVYDTSLNLLESDTFVIIVEDDEAPIAVITGPKRVAQHDEVTFSAMASMDNVGITTYSWTIDENTYSTMDVTYTFHEAGSFLIELIIEDGSNPASKAELLLFVADIDDPVIDLIAPESIGNHEIFFANASGSTDNVGITSYSWLIIMPDNNRMTGTGPTFSMGLTGVLGEIIMYLTVMDASGNSAQEVRFVQVLDTQAPTVMAPSDMEVQEGEKVTFFDMGSTDNVGVSAYKWTVEGELGTSTVWGDKLNYYFEKFGNYTITLTVYDSTGNNASVPFKVNAGQKGAGFDSDGDGMSDIKEVQYGLDPYENDADRDYDRDLLTNKQEIDMGTDPKNPDTDGDGMPDGWEVDNKLDPKVNDAPLDPDEDGVTNIKEYLADRAPQVSDDPKEKKDNSVLILILAILAVVIVLAIIAAIVVFASKLPEN